MTELFNQGYALLIGVGECAYQPLSLPVTVKDTQAIYAALIDPELCAYPNDREHIRVLNNEEATRSRILEGLKWLKEKAEVEPKATIFVYYSGHGWFKKDDNSFYLISSRTQLITQNSGLQALPSKESAKNQCVINSVQLLTT